MLKLSSGFFDVVGYLMLPLLTISILGVLLDYIKDLIKSEIVAVCNNNARLTSIENFEKLKDRNILEICSTFEKIGSVAKIQDSMIDYFLGSPYLSEIFSLPESVLNSSKPKLEVIYSVQGRNAYYQSSYFLTTLSSLLAGNLTQSTLKQHSVLISKFISSMLEKYSTHLDDNIFEVKDVFGFIQETIKNKAVITSYGKNFAKNTKLSAVIDHFLHAPVSFSSYNFNIKRKIRDFIYYYKNASYCKYLDYIVKTELLNRKTLKKYNVEFNDVMQLAAENESFDLSRHETISLSILSTVKLECQLIAPRIANFIIDISINPNVYAKLALEQKGVIEKYGDMLTLPILEKMVYLDANLLESLRFSISSVAIKKVDKSVVLSNGTLLPENAYVKFHSLIHSRNPKIFGSNSHSFTPEIHLKSGTKFSDCSERNICWGLGPNACPAREYCVIQMKLFAAIFIRKFEVSQEQRFISSSHLGLKFRDTIRHVNSKVLIRPHNIKYYKTVFKNAA